MISALLRLLGVACGACVTRDRLRVKPEITGWGQMNYPDGATTEDAREKLCWDLYDVKHVSLLLALLILLQTINCCRS